MLLPYSAGGLSQVIGILLIGGPTLVFSGLRKLNEKRVLENTPRSKVRSAAMGIVELMGMAEPVKVPVLAPVSGRPSCWWRCRVQELRSSGKSSHWDTIHETESHTTFYLKDETGRLLVNPAGAEFHVLSNTQELNAYTRTALAPVLNSWGLDDSNFFGFERRLRLVEDTVPDGAPLFVLGELTNLAEPPQARQARFHGYLEKVKADPARMREAGLSPEGPVDPVKWDNFRARIWDEFVAHDGSKAAQNPTSDGQMIVSPAQGTFVIATKSPEELEASLLWTAPATMLGGVAGSAIGAWLAFASDWNAVIIIGCIGIGLIVSLFFKSKGDTLWSSWLR